MSRILVIGATDEMSGRGAVGRPLPLRWFTSLERSMQLARIAAARHDVRLVLLGGEAPEIDHARRTLGQDFEIEPVSVESDLAELQHNLFSFSPTGLVSTSLRCAERLTHLNTQIPIWCDFLTDSLCGLFGIDASIHASGIGSRRDHDFDKVLRFGDRFSASSTSGAGALLGRLVTSRQLDGDTGERDLVTVLPPVYRELRSSSIPKIQLEPLLAESRSAFRVLCLADSQSMSQVLGPALGVVMRRFEELQVIFAGEERLVEGLDLSHRTVFLGDIDRRSLPSLYQRCHLGLIFETRGWAASEALFSLRREMGAFGLPVLSVEDQGPGSWGRHSASLTADRRPAAVAEKLIWSLGHRQLLGKLAAREDTSVEVEVERGPGLELGTELERWLDDPEPAPRPPERRIATSAPAPSAPLPRNFRSRVRLWLEAL